MTGFGVDTALYQTCYVRRTLRNLLRTGRTGDNYPTEESGVKQVKTVSATSEKCVGNIIRLLSGLMFY